MDDDDPTPIIPDIAGQWAALKAKLSEPHCAPLTEAEKDFLSSEGRHSIERRERPKVWDLFAAGWQLEWPEYDHMDTGAWRWRRPPRGKAKVGRLFASTGQAYGAMMREKGETPDG